MAEILNYSLPEHLRARRAAKRYESGVMIAGLVITVLAVVGASLLVPEINAIRKEKQLIIDPEAMKGLPPDLALLGKLGTFRALAIDWASIRAMRLKEEGKTYEAHDLHLTVCKLAPRFPQVWANAAWNMAYNISVAQYSPEARWKWVSNGIKLLRDDGIRYNPHSVTLYKQIAWIYWHKIGDILDDEHLNYKRALAVEMESVLGPPPVQLSDQEYFDWFRKIVNAPRNLEKMLAEDAEVAALVARLESVDLQPDESLLEFVARHDRPEIQARDLYRERPQEDERFKRRMEIISQPAARPAVDRLLAALRSKVLREKHKFDLDLMMHLMVDQFGPLDWRNPFAHSLYWSAKGAEMSEGYINTNESDRINNDRFIFFALQAMITRGRIVLWPNFDDPFKSYIELTPDTRYIPYLYQTYLRLGEKDFGDDPRFVPGTPGPNFMNGMVTNMHTWIELLYLEGGKENMEQAENYFAWLREHNPHPDGSTQERYLQTLDEFVMGDILDQLHTYRAAGALIRSLIQRGLKNLGLDQPVAGKTAFARARMCYEYWMKGLENDPRERRKLQRFEIIVRDETIQFMQHPQVGALFKASLWNSLPLKVRQSTYDALRPYFEKLCESQDPPWSIAAGFPEPAGIEAYRKRDIDYRNEARREGVDEGTSNKR